jgi:protease I
MIHEVVVIGDEAGSEVEGKRHRVSAEVDMTAEGVDPLDFDMLLIPCGHSPRPPSNQPRRGVLRPALL